MESDPANTYRLLSDEPVLETQRKDELKFLPTAQVLARAALHTDDPITIGVYGSWGSGKTSLMRLMKKVVADEGQAENAAVPVWFNAWQYEREEHLIIPLIATIARDIKSREKEWKKVSAGRKRSEEEKQRRDAARKALEIMKDGGEKIHNALRSVLYGLSMKGKLGVPGIGDIEISASMKDMIERYEALTQDTLMARSLYFDAFDRLRVLSQEDDSKKPQIVVFIDDLDRCFPEQAVRLLESVKLILHQRGFAFVLGIYPEIIEEFIRNKYAKEYHFAAAAADDPDLRRRMNAYLDYFRQYLDKIVQVYRRMPERGPDEMDQYIRKLVEEGKVFPDEAVDLAIPLIAEAGRRNPRAVVRLLNRIMVSSRISERESEGTPIDALGLLISEATNEERYEDFVKVLDVSVVVRAEDQEDRTLKIGELIAERLETYGENHETWISELRESKLASRQDRLEVAVKALEGSPHLCNLLKSEKGLLWLRDKAFRETLEVAAEGAPEERKREEEKAAAREREATVAEAPEGPISELESNMVWIDGTGAGTFRMGSPDDEQGRLETEGPAHDVRLDGFHISATQVTQAQYEAVIGNNPSHFKGAERPVERVSWDEAMTFCEELTKRTGRAYTLPSEAQWQYACRAGSEAAYCFGDDEATLDEYAWYSKNAKGQPHPVGEKKPNAWGLYDMHGNVWEWCRDWYGDYKAEPQDNPTGPENGSYRVRRGGGWTDDPQYCRSAIRGTFSPVNRYGCLGFRVLAVQAAGKQA